MTLNHIWSFLCFLTAASATKVSYPSINGSETLICECPDHQCVKVYWYRLLKGSNTPEFLISANILNIVHYAQKIDNNRFKSSVTSSRQALFTLRITGLQEQDAGFYSCVLSIQGSVRDPKDLMPVGYSILPGGGITTQAPTKVKQPNPVNRQPNNCKKKHNQSVKGCQSLVLWSGISAILLLVVVLISTLYYFSRLPKKCRHRFVKQRQMS